MRKSIKANLWSEFEIKNRGSELENILKEIQCRRNEKYHTNEQTWAGILEKKDGKNSSKMTEEKAQQALKSIFMETSRHSSNSSEFQSYGFNARERIVFASQHGSWLL